VTRLMANDDKFDMYYLTSLNEYFMPILQGKYYYDISVNKDISENIQGMSPNVKTMFSYDDEYFGLPIDISTQNSLFWRKHDLDRENINYDEIKSINDLIRVKNIFENSIVTSDVHIDYNSFFNVYFIYPILLGFDENTYNIDFSKINYENIMDAKKLMIESGVLIDERIEIYKCAISPRFTDMTESTYIHFPKVEGVNKNGVLIDTLAINPSSNNIDKSLEYLHTLQEMYKTNIMVCAIKNILYEDMSTYNNNSLGLDASMLITQENLDFFADFYDNHTRIYVIPGYGDLLPIMKKIYNEEIEIIDGVEQMQTIMDLISEEYTLNNPNE